MPHLRPNWEWSVFSAAAFNFGPRVIAYPHRDCMNLAYGLCAIHAFGRYDHTKGGHLVLKEAKLIIQFPPGALILVPSATITHGNTPIQEGEVRSSFTQYSAGAMFRYVDSGFKTQEVLRLTDPAGFEKMAHAKADRWKLGLELLSTVDEILDRAGVGREEGEVPE
ncbi:hypothetical protein FA13DRAFT_1642626 [Coprinellus micaceus]|uniref:Fe2OG dioxygenase domain-containing protein n=1 Tax=Coprinellus micaceus TaxID=71717 RepID=A0A4Y7SI03_COPMI|nr:hypothetical protein FA13DRAFT_1642626 [Coprinellus micaceus]